MQVHLLNAMIISFSCLLSYLGKIVNMLLKFVGRYWCNVDLIIDDGILDEKEKMPSLFRDLNKSLYSTMENAIQSKILN